MGHTIILAAPWRCLPISGLALMPMLVRNPGPSRLSDDHLGCGLNYRNAIKMSRAADSRPFFMTIEGFRRFKLHYVLHKFVAIGHYMQNDPLVVFTPSGKRGHFPVGTPF